MVRHAVLIEGISERAAAERSEDLVPFDEQQAEWCRAVIAELEELDEIDIQQLQSRV